MLGVVRSDFSNTPLTVLIPPSYGSDLRVSLVSMLSIAEHAVL
jgi:hypothetical protein